MLLLSKFFAKKEKKNIYIYKYIYITYSYETMPEDDKIMIN